LNSVKTKLAPLKYIVKDNLRGDFSMPESVSKTFVSETSETLQPPPRLRPANPGPVVSKVVSLPVVSYLVGCIGF
jgi:hypothetical protein